MTDPPSVVNKVKVRETPVINFFYGHCAVPVTLDSEATSSLIRMDTVTQLGLSVHRNSQVASQDDGKSCLTSCGGVKLALFRNNITFPMCALVSDLSCEVLADVPFLKDNRIHLDFGRGVISVQTDDAQGLIIPFRNTGNDQTSPRMVLRVDSNRTFFPGDYIDFHVPEQPCDQSVLLVPLDLSPPLWPHPCVTNVIGSHVFQMIRTIP